MKFFQIVLGSCLGVFLAGVALIGIGTCTAVSLGTAASQPTVEVASNSLLELNLDAPIPEQTDNIESGDFSLKNESVMGLHDMILTIRNAAKDDKIKGILLSNNGQRLMSPTAAAIREELIAFKKAGKFIVARSESYSLSSYHLASVADRIYLHPLGMLDFGGQGSMIPYFKDAADQLGIKFQVFYAGNFKSATEPFRRTNMSPENRLQLHEYFDATWEELLQDIAESRKKSVAELRVAAADLSTQMPQGALKAGLVDELAYRDQVLAWVKKKIGLGESDDIKVVSIQDYYTANPIKKDLKEKNKVAVVYAEGNIIDGSSASPGTVVGSEYVRILAKLRDDKNVKSVVIRVNSPGGSAIASDAIWREVKLLRKAGKPVVISMGDYAASGGYYISCAADSIFAEPTTLTGSIGVFMALPSMQGFFNNKLGVHFDTVKTAPNAFAATTVYDVDAPTSIFLQSFVDSLYGTFLSRVADGRRMKVDAVHNVAQGRIWTGAKAKQLGLVDHLGGLDAAVACAARLAKVKAYRRDEYPKQKKPVEKLVEELLGNPGGKDVRVGAAIQQEFGALYPYYKTWHELQQMQGPQMRLPLLLNR